ncbi:PulJ/GspJ family protein [Sutcliffiella horikoshii]|uniref:PulJ/GspJ family protein n=1 Tax=Sutcliffiella horikoshii TaxID=79883 RepID=UPI003CF2CA1D
MSTKRILNEHGLTLIELLATIVISSMIISLITSVFISSFKQNELVNNHNNLRQEANLIISKLRQNHQDNSYNLCYETNNQLYLDTQLSNQLALDKYYFTNVVIKNLNKSIENSGQCIENVDVLAPLFVQFTLHNENGLKFEMNTVINRLKPLEFTQPSVEDEDKDVEEEIDDNPDNYHGDTAGRCTYEGNTKTNATTFAPTWGTNCPVTKVNKGSFMLLKDATVFSQINVDHNFIATKSFRMDNTADLFVGQNANFKNNVSLFTDTSAFIESSILAEKNVELQNNSDLTVGKDVTIQEKLNMYTNSELHIGRSLTVNKSVTLENNSIIHVAKDVFLNDSLDIKGKSFVEISGDYTIKGLTKLQHNTQLEIFGDAVFQSPIELSGGHGGRVCIRGTASFSSSQNTSRIYTMASCQGQPEGTIYVLNNQ